MTGPASIDAILADIDNARGSRDPFDDLRYLAREVRRQRAALAQVEALISENENHRGGAPVPLANLRAALAPPPRAPSPSDMPPVRAPLPGITRYGWYITGHARTRAQELGFSLEDILAALRCPEITYRQTDRGDTAFMYLLGDIAIGAKVDPVAGERVACTVLLRRDSEWEHGKDRRERTPA